MKLIQQLRDEFKADDSWINHPVAWTSDLEKQLVRKDGLPILGIAHLQDVERKDEGFELHFVRALFEYDKPNIKFVLKCAYPTENRRLESWSDLEFGYGDEAEYVFIARIETLKRQDLTSLDLDRDEFTVDNRPRWIAHGQCVAIRKLKAETVVGNRPAGEPVKRYKRYK